MAVRSELTPKQHAFVAAYLANGLNGADAYRQAYNPQATPTTAGVEANRLLRHPKIAPKIAAAQAKADAAMQAAADRYAVSRERNVAELARMAYANMEDYTRLIGGERVVDLTAASRDQLAAVQEITVEDFKDGRGEDARDVRRIKFRLADKQAAIERLNKMFGWIIDRAEVGNPGDFSALDDAALNEKVVAELVASGIPEATAREFVEARRGPGKVE